MTHLKTPGLEVNEVFRRTMNDVAHASNNEQRPALYTDFAETAYLGPRPVASPAPAGTAPAQPTSTTPATPPVRPAPDGFVRINGGRFKMGSPASEPGRNSDETQRQVTVSSFYMGRHEIT